MKNWMVRFAILAMAFSLAGGPLAAAPQTPEKRTEAKPSEATPDQSKDKASESEKEKSGPAGGKAEKSDAPAKKVEKPEAEKSEPEEQPKPKGPITALVGAAIHTMDSQGVIDPGVVLIQDGKILSVGGKGTEIPEGAEKIDVSGTTMVPGLIDSRSRLWLTDSGASASASDASLNVIDGVDAFDENWIEVVRQGVTCVYVQTARNGTAGGYGAVLSVAPGESVPRYWPRLPLCRLRWESEHVTTGLGRNSSIERRNCCPMLGSTRRNGMSTTST